MKTMYRASFGRIEKVEIVKETDKFVFIKSKIKTSGIKEAKTSNYYAYRDTFEEAKQFLVDEAEEDFEKAKRELEYAARKLEQANNLTE